jgi:DNA-directed RNA polymerase subunit RPC12/RpoP
MGDDKQIAISEMKTKFPKCPVCRLFGETDAPWAQYEISGISKKYAQCKSCGAKWYSNQLPKGNLGTLTLHELPSNQTIRFMLIDLIGQELDLNDWHYLSKTIDRVGEARNLIVQQQLDQLVVLGSDEKAWGSDCAWKGGRVVQKVRVVWGNTQNSLETEEGILFLTNKRLIWVEHGILKFDIPHEQLATIQWGFMKIQTTFGDRKEGVILKSLDGKVDEILQLSSFTNVPVDQNIFEFRLKTSILSALEQRREALEQEKRRSSVQIVLDFSSIKDALAKGGIVASNFKCNNCGAMLPIPDSGKVVVCEHCGSPTKAVDLFEKLKILLEA